MSKVSYYLLRLLLFSFAAVTLLLNITIRHEQQMVFIANSFLHGKLYFIDMQASWLDSVLYKDHIYWPLGPAPSVILMPFVAVFNLLQIMFYQSYLQLILTALIFYMAWWLAKKYKYSRDDGLWLAFAFCYASVYMMVAFVSWSPYFTQAVTVACMFLSIVEWHGKKRYWLIGLCYAIILGSRFTAVLGLLFFFADLYLNRNDLTRRRLLKNITQLCLPVLIVGLLLMWYNYARFENVWDNGYMSANNWHLSKEQRFEQLNYGLFNLKNIPTNFYYYFLKTLDPVRVNHFGDFGQSFILKPPYITVKNPGTSFFVSSPIFLYIFYVFRRKKMDRMVKLSFLPVVVILVILLTYYWPGWRQIGPRYTLDFLPFLYLILLHSFRDHKLSLTAKIIIVGSALLNIYLFTIIALATS